MFTKIILTIYTISFIYLMIRFKQSNWNSEELGKRIRKDFSFIFKCCINKKKLEKHLDDKEIEKLEEDLEKIIDADNDCMEPMGIPLNVCLSEDMTKEELFIKQKVIGIVAKKNQKIVDGGKEKLVIPMESILFLTKNMNPLVSESGEINIKVSDIDDINSRAEDKAMKRIKQMVIEYKDGGEISSEDAELVEAINELIEKKMSNNLSGESNYIAKETFVPKAEKDIVTEIPVHIIEEAKEISHPVIESKAVDIAAKDTVDEVIFNKDIEDSPVEKKKEEDKVANPVPFIPDEVKDMDFEEVLDLSDYNPVDDLMETDLLNHYSQDDEPEEPINEIKQEVPTNNQIVKNKEIESIGSANNEFINFEDELASLSFDDEDVNEKETSSQEWYSRIDFLSVKGIKLDYDDGFYDSLRILLSRDDVKGALARNIAKLKPLIMNENKELILIDQRIMLYAIAKLFGIDFQKHIENMKKLTIDDLKLLNKALDESFELFISDLYTENLSNHSTFFKLTNTKLGTKHFLIGIPLQTEYFKLGLGKEYDYFRSFPFNNEYRIDGIGSKEDSNTHTRLIPDFFGLEI